MCTVLEQPTNGRVYRMALQPRRPYGPGTIFFCFALKRLNTGAINGL